MANQNTQNQNEQWKQQQRPEQQTQKPADRTGQNAQTQTGQRSQSQFQDDKSFGSADTNSDLQRSAKNRNPSTVAGEEEDVDFENQNISDEDDESFDRSSDRNQNH